MNHTDQILTKFEYTFIGVYLIVSGLVATVANLIGLFAFWRFPRLLCTPSAIPEIGLLLADLATTGLNPFSGSAALHNRWIWDDGAGCQLYAFFGFVFGDFQVLCIPFLAFDRYVITAENSALRKYRTRKTYCRVLLFIFLYALFWAVAPIIGWASFAKIAPGIVCTLNWMKVDVSFVSYLTAKFIGCFMVSTSNKLFLNSVAIAAGCYFLTFCLYRNLAGISFICYRGAILEAAKNPERKIHWCNKESIAFVSYGCMLSTYLAFVSYAMVCMWAMIVGPETIPRIANALPPVWVKLAAIFNPIFYVYFNPRLWACVKKMFGLSYDHEQMIRDKTEERIWMDSPRNTARSMKKDGEDEDVDRMHELHPRENQ